MNLIVVQVSSDLLSGAFSIAVLAGGLLLFGALISFAVFAYRSVKGDGMRDPQDIAPENAADDDVTEGGPDDEWDYY